MKSRFLLLTVPAVLMAGAAAAGTYEAPLDVRKPGEAEFTAKPEATKAGGKVKISFAVSQATDAEVAVLDSKGEVVRHLAAGLLGKSAPAPFKKGALKQEIVWDLRDDLGKPAGGGPFKVRVRLGAEPRLEKHAGWDGSTLGWGIVGLAVGPGGELYVLDSQGTYGRSTLRAFDKKGKYLRTVMPYPADTPEERTASIGQLEIEGRRLPVVFNGHGHNLHPLTSGMKKQTMAFSPKGYLLMASAVGTIVEHGPPRHLLAFHPAGGAPKDVGFVGPRIRKPRGFMGGTGEGGSRAFDHLATSPDGEWIYLTTFIDSWSYKKIRHHAVFRLKWTQYHEKWADVGLPPPFLGKKEAGADDAHFNDPQGVAVDKKGNIYVCDRGNGRVMIFEGDGKLLGKFAVENPQQIAVHPKSGEIYVSCRGLVKQGKRIREAKETRLLKFAAWKDGKTRELTRLELNTIELMALDAGASPPKLWLVLYRGWGKPQALVPVLDRGGKLAAGEAVDNANGLVYPMFIAADGARERVYVTEYKTKQMLLDLKTGKLGKFKTGIETALDRQGNVYILNGWKMFLERYDPGGKPLPFPTLKTHKIGPLGYVAKGPDVGLRGHTVAPGGDIHILKMGFYGRGNLLIYGPDGGLKKKALVARIVHGSSGLGVDPAGNIYLGSNLKPQDRPFPQPFMGKLPTRYWVWWRWKRQWKRSFPWCYPYYNAYLYHWGAVFKFPPAGGEFFGGMAKHEIQKARKQGEEPPKAPEGTPAYKTGYLTHDAWVKGALWRYAGYGPVPTSGLNWGDPSCTCWTARLAVDGYGRVFVPDVFQFSVAVLDTAGNRLTRVGAYGNADSAGPKSKVPKPEIAFAWPAFTSVSGGKLYVSDPLNRRVTIVRFEHAAEAACAVP